MSKVELEILSAIAHCQILLQLYAVLPEDWRDNAGLCPRTISATSNSTRANVWLDKMLGWLKAISRL
jgi:hypothetical protein